MYHFRRRKYHHNSESSTVHSDSSRSTGTDHAYKNEEKNLPCIEPPDLKAADSEGFNFYQRHEANTVELFFDLFFVANLATFTYYHAILSGHELASYVGFFFILWSTWFHTTLFDVRFARDCIYERTCKVVQFFVFIGLALVGYNFTDIDKGANNSNFQTLCWILFISRCWQALQYAVILFFCWTRTHRPRNLILPLLLSSATFLITAVIYASSVPRFSSSASPSQTAFLAWWIPISFEMVASIAISCTWRKLSYRKTHLGERMGLLCLIIIGEGVIGTSKTVSRLMGKHGPYIEGVGMVLSIILILVFIWVLYFDNYPHHNFGTIKQQLWAFLHLPLHLSILGVVEGSQHMALARYLVQNQEKMGKLVESACFKDQMSGPELRDTLVKDLEYFKLNSTLATAETYNMIMKEVYALGNNSDLCSSNTSISFSSNNPIDSPAAEPFNRLFSLLYGGMFQAAGINLPTTNDAANAALQAMSSFFTVYRYYWSAILMLIVILTAMILLSRPAARMNRFIVCSLPVRILITGVALFNLIEGVVSVSNSEKRSMSLIENSYYGNYVSSPWILPTVCLSLFAMIVGDYTGRWWMGRKNRHEISVDSVEEKGILKPEGTPEGGLDLSRDATASLDSQ